jgi:hypothetical protein
MAFSYTVTSTSIRGNKRVINGTFTNDSSSGGDIVTGLTSVETMALVHTGDTVISDVPTVNETMPCTGTVSIVTVADKNGTWEAVGY